jgi:hypothetical protein
MRVHHRRFVIVLPLLLAACGMRPAEKGLVGTWELDKDSLRNAIRAELDKDPRANNPQARAFVEVMLQQFDNVTATIELKPDRTFHAAGKGFGTDDTNDGTWRLDGNQVVLEGTGKKNDQTMRLTKVSNTVLRFEQEQRGKKLAIELHKKSSGTPAAPR